MSKSWNFRKYIGGETYGYWNSYHGISIENVYMVFEGEVQGYRVKRYRAGYFRNDRFPVKSDKNEFRRMLYSDVHEKIEFFNLIERRRKESLLNHIPALTNGLRYD